MQNNYNNRALLELMFGSFIPPEPIYYTDDSDEDYTDDSDAPYEYP